MMSEEEIERAKQVRKNKANEGIGSGFFSPCDSKVSQGAVKDYGVTGTSYSMRKMQTKK